MWTPQRSQYTDDNTLNINAYKISLWNMAIN